MSKMSRLAIILPHFVHHYSEVNLTSFNWGSDSLAQIVGDPSEELQFVVVVVVSAPGHASHDRPIDPFVLGTARGVVLASQKLLNVHVVFPETVDQFPDRWMHHLQQTLDLPVESFNDVVAS